MKVNKYIGNGLALYETEKGTLVWRVKFNWEGKQTSMSLGEASLIDESEAIQRSHEVKKMIAMNKDPRVHRTWVRPKKEYAREYLISLLEKKVKEVMEMVEIMKKQGYYQNP